MFAFICTLSRNIIPAIVCTLSGISIFLLQTNMLEEGATLTSTTQNSSLKDINFSKTLSEIGYSGFGASTLWLSFVQYFGGEAGIASGYQDNAKYLQEITRIEPRFISPYGMVVSSLGFRSAQPQIGKEILEFGIENITPDINVYSYRLPLQLALINFLFLGDAEGGRDAYHLASDRYEEGFGTPANQWRELGDELYDNPRSQSAQFNIWGQVLASSEDEVVRERAYSELARLGSIERLPNGQIQILPPEEN